MTRNPSIPPEISDRLSAMKAAFSNSNMVRMREALRYLKGAKLKLFISIPFYLHANRKEFPGFVRGTKPAHGIFNFKASGFYRAGLLQGLPPEAGEYPETGAPPCILGLYHIGSLGTFTQSGTSDFDFWVIVDKGTFSPERHEQFQGKLDDIVRYARETCGQKVTFFVMDRDEIRRDCYTGLNERETLTAPKLFLKEEFYRTFLHIAGKIPLWTVLPPGCSTDAYPQTVKHLCAHASPNPVNRDFMDLGNVGTPDLPDIFKGILWHVVKSKADPVKALIKATMVFSHQYGASQPLLCDEIKAGYAQAGIDDYRADPYKTLFDRVIAFHESHDPKNLNLVKNAIFLRLCGFPRIRLPEKGSPKRQLLDRYIRAWNLKPSKLKKILSYENWVEEEKQVLESSFVSRLSEMYARAGEDVDLKALQTSPTERRNLTILLNKARERLNRAKGKIRPCSTFLRACTFNRFLFRWSRFKGWELAANLPDSDREAGLNRSESFLELMGWIMANRLYKRSQACMTMTGGLSLFGSADAKADPDAVYLSVQPVTPLSENPFEFAPALTKLIVLIISPGPDAGPEKAEFLFLNTWGELFARRLNLDRTRPIDDRYRQIAEHMNGFQGASVRLHFFQLAEHRDKDAVFRIKQHLDKRFLTGHSIPGCERRPLLDKL